VQYVNRFKQVVNYLPVSVIEDMLNRMEDVALTNHVYVDSDDDDVPFENTHSPKPVRSRQLFSSPARRMKKKKNDLRSGLKKKPRRRKRKENGGYDRSPTMSVSHNDSADEDGDDFELIL
jgi:hypothetical protein